MTTTDDLTRTLALLSEPRDADGLAKSNDPRGMMVGADELAYRRAIEGGNATLMCAGCGYGLAPADPICPKCGSGAREVATALVPRELPACPPRPGPGPLRHRRRAAV